MKNKQIIKYFDQTGKETTPNNAERIIVQEVDRKGNLTDERIYNRVGSKLG